MVEFYSNGSFPMAAGAAACASLVSANDDALLGTYAKSITPSPESEAVRALIAFNLAERYRLLAHARHEFLSAGRRAGLEFPHNYCRTAKCKYVQYGSEYVGVYVAPEFGSAFYSGLVTCGSVWACPVCSAKVQQRRRGEVSEAIDWAHENGLQSVMVTLTFPHCNWHKLKKLLLQQRMALQRLRAGGPWNRFKQRFGYHYLIRALEVTHGENGWHPHVHELWFVDGNADADEMQTVILRMWESACQRAGLNTSANREAFHKHSVDIKGHCSNSDYLAKQDDSRHWGADREIATATTKAGKAKGLHPFGLLARAADGDRRAGRLFLTYALAMKGQRQLVWSPGLKRVVGLREITDESLAEQRKEAADLLGMLSSEDWKRVRSANKRAQVLLAAERGGWPAIQELILTLRTMGVVARSSFVLTS